MTPPPPQLVGFIHDTGYDSLPQAVRHQMRRCLLDLLGVAAAGTRTPMSRIMRDHAHRHGAGTEHAPRLLFDGRRAAGPMAALANAATIDSMDGHDGHRLVKGHAGAAVLPAALAFLDGSPTADSHDLVAALAVGYEVALRAGLALHGSAADYHSSGAWNALGAAAVGSRMLGLDAAATRHALGIAEYSAPRAPMMRAIAHPTMVKDSSAWGAQAGVAAAMLASDGFTGAPADLTAVNVAWEDLGNSWRCLELYFKPYPVCRWAQPAVAATLELATAHGITPNQVVDVQVTTFEAAAQLHTTRPKTTEEAQYSLPFAVAAALSHGILLPETVIEPSKDRETQRLMDLIQVVSSPSMTAEFPSVRRATVTIGLSDGRSWSSGPTTAKGDPEDPLTDQELVAKFECFSDGLNRADGVDLAALLALKAMPLGDLLEAVSRPLLTDPPTAATLGESPSFV
jgi:2-methylcitrate dehydratase PrpD